MLPEQLRQLRLFKSAENLKLALKACIDFHKQTRPTTSNKMKTRILTIVAALFVAALNVKADTNSIPDLLVNSPVKVSPTISGGFQQIYDAALDSTNFAVAVGYGRSLKGNNSLAFIAYNYNLNNLVAMTLGFDDIGHGTKFTSDNIDFVKGGLTLQTEIAPLKNWGLPNFKVTPFGSLLMSSGNGRVGQIVVAGANWRIGIAKGWYFNLGGEYENRSGDGLPTDGAYIAGHLAVSKSF